MEDDEPGADWNLTYGQEKALLRLLGEDRLGTPGDCENALWRLFSGPEPLNEWLDEVRREASGWNHDIQRLAEFEAILRRGRYDGPPVEFEAFREFLNDVRENGVPGWRTDYSPLAYVTDPETVGDSAILCPECNARGSRTTAPYTMEDVERNDAARLVCVSCETVLYEADEVDA